MAKIEAKQVVVNEIKDKLSRAASVVVVDARGLTVEQDTALRKSLREAGVDYKVYKNTMVTLAVKDTPFEGLAQYLEGPSAFAFSYGEATTAAAILDKAARGSPWEPVHSIVTSPGFRVLATSGDTNNSLWSI